MAPPDLEALRPRAFAVGYRMLGSIAEAEDIAQETLLRVSVLSTPPDEPMAWVTTVATRLAIDHLRLARVRRESYVGPWLPEPLVVDGDAGPGSGPSSPTPSPRPCSSPWSGSRRSSGRRSSCARSSTTTTRGSRRCSSAARRAAASSSCGPSGTSRRSGPASTPTPSRAERCSSASWPRPRTATWPRSRRCSPTTSSSTATAAARPRRRPSPSSGSRRWRTSSPTSPSPAVSSATSSVQWVRVNGQPGRVLRDPRGVWDVLAIDVVEGRIGAVRIVRNPDKLRHL